MAPTGSDSNAGTRDAPFATWARALVASRASSKPMTVVFRAGTYPLNATIVLTPEDSGTTFRSALGEKVHFRSGAALSGWRFLKPSDRGYGSLPPASRPHVLVAPLPPLPRLPRFLLDDSRAGARAASILPGQSELGPRPLCPQADVVCSLATADCHRVPLIATDSLALRLTATGRHGLTRVATDAVYSLATARQNVSTVWYVGQYDDAPTCRAAAAEGAAAISYAWHDPSVFTDDFGGGCYARLDQHGTRIFHAQEGVTSGLFAPTGHLRQAATHCQRLPFDCH